MKRDLFYNFLLISLFIHLLCVLPGFADFGHPRVQEKEPLAVEITGPVYAAPKALPQLAQKQEPRPPVSAEPVIPSPETAQPIQPAPPPAPVTEGRGEDGLNGSSPAEVQGISGCNRNLVNHDGLMRYAEADDAILRDYLITSYVNRLSSLMDRRMGGLLQYSASRTNDPAVEFTIRSGELYNIAIVRSSGSEKLDNAVMQALLDTTPFDPLPGIWKGRDISFIATINIY